MAKWADTQTIDEAAWDDREARMAELEAALRPFGNAYRFVDKMGSMRSEYLASMTCTGECSSDDFRRAAELTAPADQGG